VLTEDGDTHGRDWWTGITLASLIDEIAEDTAKIVSISKRAIRCELQKTLESEDVLSRSVYREKILASTARGDKKN